MQETSAVYRRILADDNHWFEVSVVIGEGGDLVTERGETILFGGTAIVVARSNPESGYTESQIFSIRTDTQMFGSSPEIGNAVSQEIELKMLRPIGEIPLMAQIIPYVRACSEEETSEWIQQGIFYIDTREYSNNEDGLDVMTIHGYDAMLRAEQPYASTSLSWPATDINIVREIAGKIGVQVDPRTVALMTSEYTLPLPTSYSLREILCYIAAKYLGCFIISDIGELRLVSLLEMPAETNYLIDQIGDVITFGGDRIKV